MAGGILKIHSSRKGAQVNTLSCVWFLNKCILQKGAFFNCFIFILLPAPNDLAELIMLSGF